MLIGFAGKRTAGKTRAAKILIEEYGFLRAKFADPIKEACRVAYGLTYEHTDGALKERPSDLLGGKTPRDVMEWIGEGSRERFGKDVWVKRWFALYGGSIGAVDHVFDDVRNPTEAEAIKSHGGRVFRVFNADADALPILPSERELVNITPSGTIVNDRDARFDSAVRAIAERMLNAPQAAE